MALDNLFGSTMNKNEIKRIQEEYQRRDQGGNEERRYSLLDPPNLYFLQKRESVLLSTLRHHNVTNLSTLKLLDLGCGSGGELLRWISYGFSPSNCEGVELMPERVKRARSVLPQTVRIQHGDAKELPYADQSFDLVTQFTVFSSILDTALRQAIAAEMLRVLKSTGLIIWYDFWLNPTNPQTRGIRPKEICSLFPNCQFQFHRITLAPPIARRLAPFSTTLCSILEDFKIFNSHYLVVIQKSV